MEDEKRYPETGRSASMRVIVPLVGMARMVVIVRAVLPGMVVVVGVGVGPVGMIVLVLVQMLVGVAVGVFVGVGFVLVAVLVGMGVAMVVGVQVLVFVFAFHGLPPFRRGQPPQGMDGQPSPSDVVPGNPGVRRRPDRFSSEIPN